MGAQDHRLIIGVALLAILALVDGTALLLVIEINWATLPGPEAGIVSSIITAIVSNSASMAQAVIGYYFNSSPTTAS